MSISFNKEKNICTINMEGLLTSEQIIHTFDAAVSHVNYTSGMARLWDFREADLSRLTADAVMGMAHYSQSFPEGIKDVKCAFLVKRDMELGLANMFTAYSAASKTPIQVFKNIQEAEEWLTEM